MAIPRPLFLNNVTFKGVPNTDKQLLHLRHPQNMLIKGVALEILCEKKVTEEN